MYIKSDMWRESSTAKMPSIHEIEAVHKGLFENIRI